MSQRFVISDTHFGHKGILTKPDRGAMFRDVHHMDSHMIHQWNSVTNKRSIVYHLGDFCMHDANYTEDLLKRLNGHIVIIAGNHDDNLPNVEYVYGALKKRVHGKSVIMTHIPIHPQEFYRWKYNVHGHLHENRVWTNWRQDATGSVTGTIPDKRYINVSVEQLNYTPTPLEQVIPK